MTPKQQAFVEHYAACGNATEAARLAGYKNPNVAGPVNTVKHSIQEALKTLTAEVSSERIATATEVQEYWSDLIRGEKEGDPEMLKLGLKASELLSRARGDFVDRKEHTGKDGAPLTAPDVNLVFVNALPVVD